jgi:hypothetical protein
MDPARERLMAELRSIARGEASKEVNISRDDAEREWQAAQVQNFIWIAGMLALTGVAGALCFGGGTKQYAGAAVLICILFIGIFMHRKRHRAAFVAREMAYGSNKTEANSLYNRKYD